MDKITKHLGDSKITDSLINAIRSYYGHDSQLIDKNYSELSSERISLSPVDGFLVSNTLISDIQLAFDNLLLP